MPLLCDSLGPPLGGRQLGLQLGLRKHSPPRFYSHFCILIETWSPSSYSYGLSCASPAILHMCSTPLLAPQLAQQTQGNALSITCYTAHVFHATVGATIGLADTRKACSHVILLPDHMYRKRKWGRCRHPRDPQSAQLSWKRKWWLHSLCAHCGAVGAVSRGISVPGQFAVAAKMPGLSLSVSFL